MTETMDWPQQTSTSVRLPPPRMSPSFRSSLVLSVLFVSSSVRHAPLPKLVSGEIRVKNMEKLVEKE